MKDWVVQPQYMIAMRFSQPLDTWVMVQSVQAPVETCESRPMVLESTGADMCRRIGTVCKRNYRKTR